MENRKEASTESAQARETEDRGRISDLPTSEAASARSAFSIQVAEVI